MGNPDREKKAKGAAGGGGVEKLDTQALQPDDKLPDDITPETAADAWHILAGTDEGLVAVDRSGKFQVLHQGGSVRKILFAAAKKTVPPHTWIILGSEGILVSDNLTEWEQRNNGLPVKTIKIFNDGNKTFLPMVQEIKDLKINPQNQNIFVCATKDCVFLSRNQGRSWTSLGAPAYRTNGIKAVATAFLDDELTVFLSHSTYGIFCMQPDKPGAQWAELNRGIETLETTGNADEVSDIAVLCHHDSGVNSADEIFISQTFRRRIYKLDWNRKTFIPVWSDNNLFGTVDSLNINEKGLCFLLESTVAQLDFPVFQEQKPGVRKRQDLLETINSLRKRIKANCIMLHSDGNDLLALNELWLLDEPEPDSGNGKSYAQSVSQAKPELNREGLYMQVNHVMDEGRLGRLLETMERGGLNMIVIDMKDDYGRLRFTPHDPALGEKGRIFRPLDIDSFLAEMKGRGIYTVARVVVFKDPELASKENGRFAVWDGRNARPWKGYYDARRIKTEISDEDRRNTGLKIFPSDNPDYEIVRTFYDEQWVDPYSEEVWEYIASLAAELHERGFDEIQFDYIRFPTDGDNLGDARYRWQENGMDMESAILSFLRHVRRRVQAPISIDIYGANGWYRTGARTGQEVELLAPWVDVICPMYYPSHFEQHFLAQNPPELRPWRIYYMGTLRTSRIGRGQVIVRPYVQSFFLNVSYDRKYYNADYVLRQIEGARAAGNGGFTCWNNSGRYDEIPISPKPEPK